MDQWGEQNEDDLIWLGSPDDKTDRFTRWVNTKVVSWFHDRWGCRNSVCSNDFIFRLGLSLILLYFPVDFASMLLSPVALPPRVY